MAPHLDKVLFPKDTYTKEDLLHYYSKIASKMLPFFKGRPLTLQRYPRGIAKEGFIQKNLSGNLLKAIPTLAVKTQKGKIKMPLCPNKKVLESLAALDTVTFHIPLSKEPFLDKADKIIFDLDPSSDNFSKVKEVSFYLKELLEESLKLSTQVMTTGSRGVHIILFLKNGESFDETKAFAKDVATYVVKKYPKLCTVSLRKEARGSKVFIDYLRNAPGQTSVAPYSIRPLQGAPIAAPITWSQLKKASFHAQSFNLNNAHLLLNQKTSPWKIRFITKQQLIKATQDLKELLKTLEIS